MIQIPENTAVGPYRIQRLIKESGYNASYLAADENGAQYFLKFFDPELVPERLMEDGTVLEISNCRLIKHPNIISYVSDAILKKDGKSYPFIVAPFFRGHLLSEILKAGGVFSSEEAKSIILPVLDGLSYLHRELNLCHNDICPQNILLEDQDNGSVIPKIIDLGHTYRMVMGAPPFPVEDLYTQYMAPEALKGVFTDSSDVFSAAAVLYAMVDGKAPWECNTKRKESFAERKAKVRAARQAGLTAPEEMDPVIAKVCAETLQRERTQRPTADELIKFISKAEEKSPETRKTEKTATGVQVRRNTKGEGGFADIAGMETLKEDLYKRVIWVLKDKEKAEKYRLTPPNGMLLYGPPGCGKTFFAQKFAEESGFNYMLVNGSDLGSIYVHGTQNKIADLFKEAEKNAPSVICFDEFDAFVPNRGSQDASHKADEVNEFLSQLNNCAQRGIFVIGTTNRMDMIDPAVLRKGRLDLHVEIPAPDLETRKKMFQIHLKDRPQEENLNLDNLAGLTEGYASSDIAFLVNEAAMVAALSDELISEKHLEDSIHNNPSSLGKEHKQTKIGF